MRKVERGQGFLSLPESGRFLWKRLRIFGTGGEPGVAHQECRWQFPERRGEGTGTRWAGGAVAVLFNERQTDC